MALQAKKIHPDLAPTMDAPLEDRIEAATLLGAWDGKAGETNPNPYPSGSPEASAWQSAYDANKPPPFDIVAYAREMGVTHAKAGAGFVNPYPIGTPERRAWQTAYNSTPKGVPQVSGPQGRSEAEFTASVVGQVIEQVAAAAGVTNLEPLNAAAAHAMRGGTAVVEAVFSGGPPSNPDPYTNLLAAAKRQGRTAREQDQPIGANPYNDPASRLEGPAEAWAAGWRETDELTSKAKTAMESMPLVGFSAEQLYYPPTISREAVALAVFPFWLSVYQTNTPDAARWAVASADMLLEELKK